MSTDEAWEKWGTQDPYYAILTDEKFRRENLSKEAREEFFRPGKPYIRTILNTCKKHLDPAFAPKNGLDFGCGIGRITIPMAEVMDHVTGVDVAQSMLQEARKNCDEHQLTNVSLLQSDDELSALRGTYDFIHSSIVFQHIPLARGRKIFEHLLSHLSGKGIAVIQFTYAKSWLKNDYGIELSKWVEASASKEQSQRGSLSRLLPGVFRKVRDTVAAQLGKDPEMQMNSYNLNELLFLMQIAGISNFYTEFTDHGGELGVMLYFQKPA